MNSRSTNDNRFPGITPPPANTQAKWCNDQVDPAIRNKRRTKDEAKGLPAEAGGVRGAGGWEGMAEQRRRVLVADLGDLVGRE
jgi:hypothetical protein